MSVDITHGHFFKKWRLELLKILYNSLGTFSRIQLEMEISIIGKFSRNFQ